MDAKKQDQSQKKYNKYNFVKRTQQFVISVSVFSFFVWYYSGFSILPQSFNAYFCTCLFSILTRTLERKYMFLICNAILALLAKSLVLTSSSPFDDIDLQASNTTKAQEVSEETVFPLGSFQFQENAPLMVEAEEETEQAKKQEKYSEDEGEEEHGTGTLFSENERRVNEDSVVEEELELDVAGKDEGEW